MPYIEIFSGKVSNQKVIPEYQKKFFNKSIFKFRFKLMRAAILLVLFCLNLSFVSFAAVWPDDVNVQADGAIVIEAETGTVLYEKNSHERYFPASITKLLTALIIVERCNLDDTLTFSYNAVHNVESGSSSAGFLVGDTVTVKDALYAMLLQSANEAANALAEHCSGSIEEFAGLMNEKAAELNCTDSHFENPSGLNNPEHYTTASDFAIISRAALSNPTVFEIASSVAYHLPPYKAAPEGFDIYNHHGMIRRSNPNFYEYAVGGKTGYTMLAGNTLVTYGIKDNMSLITVVLNGHKTHYSDTKALMEFGFNKFDKIEVDDSNTDKRSIDIRFIQDSENSIPSLISPPSHKIVLPKDAQVSDVTHRVNFEPTLRDEKNIIANIEYMYGDRQVGYSPLYINADIKTELVDTDVSIASPSSPYKNVTKASDASFSVKFTKFMIKYGFYFIMGLIIAVIIIIILIIIRLVISYKEAKELAFLREERRKRRIMYGWSKERIDLSEHSRKKRGRRNFFESKKNND